MSNPVNEDDRANGLTAQAREVEAGLSRLRPSADVGAYEGVAINDAALAFRDRVMFRAGEAAGEQNERSAARRQVWAWRGAAAALAAVSVAVSVHRARQPRGRMDVVYVHDTKPRTQEGPGNPATHELSDRSTELQDGQPDRGADVPAPAVPAAGWMGVRGEYLSTRAAVLRWGVAALPRVDESAGEGSTPRPLDEVNKLFWHKIDGGRL